MSRGDEPDEPDEKITVLFPDGSKGDTEGEEGPSSQREEGGTSEAEESDSGDEGPPEDNVVRLDFDGDGGDTDAGESGGEIDVIDDAAGGDRVKYEIFKRMIDEGMVMVTLDPRVPGVEVPPKFEGLPELRLNFSHLFHIDDFDYDARGVRASLSFEGVRHFCDVPWSAVSMLYSHETSDLVVFEPSELE